MKDFTFSEEVYSAIKAQAEQEYPSECCGYILETADKKQAYVACENLQDKYHKLDPESYPRTSKEAFLMNTLQLTRAIDEAEAGGGRLYSIVHSHIDVGAYFSAEDKHQMSREGSEVYPSACYLVVNVNQGRVDSDAVFYFDSEKKDFIEGQTIVE